MSLALKWRRRVAPVAPAKSELPSYPIVGLLSVLSGTVLAVSLVPGNIDAPEALYPTGTALSAALLIAPVLAGLKNPKSALRVEHLLMLGLVYWLLMDLLQSAYGFESIERSSVISALTGIGLFAGGIWAAALFKPPALPNFIRGAAERPLESTAVFKLGFLCFSLGMLSYAIACDLDPILMFNALLGDRWSAPWARGQLGGWEAFRDHLQYFGYLLPALTVVLARQRSWTNPATLASLAMSFVILLFLTQGGGRRIIGVTLGSALIIWVLTAPRVGVIQIFKACLFAVAVLVYMQLMLEYRNVGFGELVEERELRTTRKHLHVDDNLYRLAQVMELVPSQHPYVYGGKIYYILSRPIPRVFWPGKPVDSGFNLADALGAQGVSYSSSIVADWYIMYGMVTVAFGGLFYGFMARMWSRLLPDGRERVTSSLIMYCIGAMAIFASLRQLDELVLQAYPLLGWLALTQFFKRKTVSPKAQPSAVVLR